MKFPRILLVSALSVALVGCSSTGASSAPADLKTATFDVRHELEIKFPEGSNTARAWFAMPQDTQDQSISGFEVASTAAWRVGSDSDGNKLLYVEASRPATGKLSIVTTFAVTRREVRTDVDASRARPLANPAPYAKWLEANKHVVIDDRIRALAAEIAGSETNPVRVARRLYDWTLENVEYWVKDPKNRKASPVGSTEHCLTTRTGNCTDFHSLWTSLARARGLPTRMVYGVFLKKELDGQDVDSSYHCWPEFYADGIGWIPHDVAVADIYAGTFPLGEDNATLVRRTTADGYQGPDPAKVEYYFGNLEERRVVFSSGRDLALDPPAASGRINALPKAYVEIDGKTAAEKEVWTRKLTYKQRVPGS